jgi:predicted GTPase
MPPIIFVANKCEDGFEGDVLSDFYLKFPEAVKILDQTTGQAISPLHVSAEHGDGMIDLLQRIQANIPDMKYMQFKERKAKRLSRFKDYKKMLLDEIVAIKQESINKH